MPWTYDLVRLHRDVKASLPDNTTFSVELEVWDHAHRDGTLDVSVKIWDSRAHQSFSGPTPDVALAALQGYYQTRDLQPEDLGLVAMPD